MAEQLEALKRAHATLVVERDRLAKDLEETFQKTATEQLIVVLQAIEAIEAAIKREPRPAVYGTRDLTSYDDQSS
jgi:hypothetical protein